MTNISDKRLNKAKSGNTGLSSTESISDIEAELKCIQPGCDNNGTIAVAGEDGDPEPEQCQYCDQVLFPMKSRIRTKIKKLLEGMVVEEKTERNSTGAWRVKDYRDMWNAARAEQLTKLKKMSE